MGIIELLRVLADTSDNQAAYLVDLGTFPSTDELALQFTDAYHVFKGKLDEGSNSIFLKEKILKNLDSINLLFDEMSNISHNSFWNVSSLGSAEWDNVRKLAGETLQLILNSKAL